MHPKNTLLAAVAIAASLVSPLSMAGTITSLAGSSPVIAGTGLNGAYYDTNVGSNSAADSVFSSSIATGMFRATTINYGAGTSVPDTGTNVSVATYLGSNASNLVGNFSSTLETALYHFTGFINITSAMDITPGGTIDVKFRVGSDDGMRLNIGGTTVAEANYARAYGTTDGTASFQSAGLYAIDLVYWENYGNTGVDLQWQTGSSGTFQDVATASLYTAVPASSKVPEPATLALVGLGLLAASRARRL